MPQIGKYFGSACYFVVNPVGGPGVRLTGDAPASVYETLDQYNDADVPGDGTPVGTVQVWSHGLMTDYGRSNDDEFVSRPQQMAQAFTSATLYAQGVLTYDHARNKSVAVAGEITFAPGTSGVIVKARSTPYASDRLGILECRAVTFIVPTAPATNALAPGLCSPSLVSRFTKDDIDLTTNAAVAPVVGAPSPRTLLQLVGSLWENQNPKRPDADRITATGYEPFFRRDAAKILADAMLVASSSAGTADQRAQLRAALVTQAEDTVQSLDRGARFNYPQTDGGVQNGRKSLVVFAACLTGDSLMESWASRTDWAIEDVYCQYITEEHLTLFGAGVSGIIDGFLPGDLGVPWWLPGQTHWGTGEVREYPWRTFWRRSYQQMFHRHMVAAHALAGLWTNYKTLWNNQVVWDYCDRMHYRTLYNGSGPVAKGLEQTPTNGVTAYHAAAFAALAPAAVWNW